MGFTICLLRLLKGVLWQGSAQVAVAAAASTGAAPVLVALVDDGGGLDGGVQGEASREVSSLGVEGVLGWYTLGVHQI